MRGLKILGSILISLVLLFSLVATAVASISPASLKATLEAGGSIQETKSVHVWPPNVDVVFAFDLSGSMADIIDTATDNAIDIMDQLESDFPGIEIHYGVMSYIDYPSSYSYCGYAATYGGGTDYAYSLDQKLTGDTTTVATVIGGFTASGGADTPQDYTRVFYESYADFIGETNPTYGEVGWRDGAKHILVNFADNVPHDCDINEDVPGKVGTLTRGGDPGRDEIIGNADDLDLQTILAGMAANGVTLLECHATATNNDYWAYWTGITGGDVFLITSATLVDDVVGAVDSAINAPVDGVHLEVNPPAYASWLESVSPPYYNGVTPCTTVDFDIVIRVPAGTSPGIYNFTISALDENGVNYGDQSVEIEVIPTPTPPLPPPPTPGGPVGITVMPMDKAGLLLPWLGLAGLLVLGTGAGLFARRRVKR